MIQELRIGNFVYSEFQGKREIEEVENICNGYINPWVYEGVENNMNKYSPIPLTPAILEKIGFEKLGEEESDIFYRLRMGYFFGAYIEITGNFIDGFWNHFGGNINSLHQLQNLYYSLTGTELTITL